MNLPNVFQNNNIEVDVENQQKLFYGNKPEIKKEVIPSSKSVDAKIRSLFLSTNYVYKIKVNVVTKDNSFNTVIIGKNNSSLITYDNELIPIKDIIDIYEID